jgi:hypothetical protein
MLSTLKYLKENFPKSPELFSISMIGVHVEPKPGSEWQDARLVLASATPWGLHKPQLKL